MNTTLWVVQWLLAAVFVMSGGRKIALPFEKFAEAMPWARDFSPRSITAIGVLEVLAALGLTAAPLLGVAPVLAPVAAVGLVGLMVGAIPVHARHHETQVIVVNVVLLALAAFVAVGRIAVDPL